MSKTKQKTREVKRAEIAKISQKMAQIAFEELNLNPNGTLKVEESNDPVKTESVSGKAFAFGLKCLVKKAVKMQLLINKLLLKGFKGVYDLTHDENTFSFTYNPMISKQGKRETEQQTQIKITIEDLL